MHGRHVFEMVGLVQHQPAIRRQHGGFLPVVRRHPHGEIGRQQMVVHHDDVSFRGAPPRLEQEAALEMGALEPRAQIGLRRHRVPHVAARLVGQVGERAVARPGGPRRQAVQLHPPLVFEQRVPLLPGLLEARQADVVPPSLEQRERRRMVASAERTGENREVLPDELLLQIDRVGGHDGPFAVLAGPHERRHQIRERLSHPGPRFEHADPTVVVEVGDVGRHVALAGAIFEAAERAGHRTAGREQARDVDRIDAGGGARPRALDHHVAVGDLVVHDREADAAVVQPCGNAQIRARRLEHAAGVVVQQQLATHRDSRKRQHGVHRAARHDPCLHHQAVRVETGDERHLPPVCRRDLGAHQFADRGGQALDAHVFSSRFLAAGKSTLLRINR